MNKKLIDVYVTNIPFGNKLRLQNNNKTKDFKEWSVNDPFNGTSPVTPIDEPIYGFYSADRPIDVYLYDANKNKTSIVNVIIERDSSL